MNTTLRPNNAFVTGAKVAGKGVVVMAKTRPLIFLWVNFFATWFIGGGALMLYWGSTSVLPLVCVLTPLVALTWLFFTASKYGFSRILGMPRVVPWLVAMAIAVNELIQGSYVEQPSGYYTFLVGFVIINGIASLIDFVDIVKWVNGDRAELFDTGFFREQV